MLFHQGMDRFPTDPMLRASYALFVISVAHDTSTSMMHLKRGIENCGFPDIKLLLMCIDRRRRLEAMSLDGGQEEIEHSLAQVARMTKKYQEMTLSFFRTLLKENNIGSLPDIVARIDKLERNILVIFTRLNARFPRSSKILRARARFLEEIKKNPEEVMNLLALADQVEEEETARRKRKKHHHSSSKATARHNKVAPEISSVGEQEQAQEQDHGVVTFANDVETIDVSCHKSAREQVPATWLQQMKHDFEPEESSADEEAMEESQEQGPHTPPEGEHSHRMVPMAGLAEQGLEQSAAKMWQPVAVNNRLAEYRMKIGNFHSTVFRQLMISIWVILGIILLNLVLIYVLSRFGMQTTKSSLTNIHDSATCRSLTPAGNLYTRFLEVSCASVPAQCYPTHDNYRNTVPDGVTEDCCNFSRMWLHKFYTKYFAALSTLYKHSGSTGSGVAKAWNEEKYYVNTYGINSTNVYVTKQSLWWIASEFLRKFAFVADTPEEEIPDLETSPEFKFVLWSGAYLLKEAYQDLVDAYINAASTKTLSALIALVALTPVSCVLIVFVVMVLFWRALRASRRERCNVLHLFCQIPKKSILHILKSYEDADTEDFVQDDSEMSYDRLIRQIRIPAIRSLSIRLFSALTLIMSCLISMFVIGLTSLVQFQTSASLIDNNEMQRMLFRHQHFLAIELLENDVGTFPGGRTQIRLELNRTLEEYKKVHYDLYFSQGLADVIWKDNKLNKHFYGTNCTDWLKTIFGLPRYGPCNGLEDFRQIYIDHMSLLAIADDNQLTWDNPHWEIVHTMDRGYLDSWNSDTEVVLLDITLGKISNSVLYISLIFAIAVPLVFASFFLVYPPMRRIKQETECTLRMFLLLDLETIESTPAIKQFLESGEQETATRKMARKLEETTAKTASILHAAADAIVVTNSEFIMETVNPSAEKMLGFSASEMLGESITLILGQDFSPERWVEDASKQDSNVQALRKDGTAIPVMISCQKSMYQGKAMFAIFIRDVRDIKLFTQLNQDNERLLGNILPKVIAQRIKSKRTTLIADSFPEVSILFADIVNFTDLSSNIEAEELVDLLNRLFSIFDALTDKLHVEKVKTIGDCYMAAAGCPEANEFHAVAIAEFGITMLEALTLYNKRSSHHISMRIGVNSGSVVAGVIGTKKIFWDVRGPSPQNTLTQADTALGRHCERGLSHGVKR
eukprot:TRINITY_DN4286_c0_g1_i10.p1 TRINITY_DN4286_c0_g1~~TRINITY_DN4286_c0_g1_i10.p1  ORF type:complete len:1194 (-),score=274.99 TRINITY_DN4286_c0_g1_i10:312-3893(-)